MHTTALHAVVGFVAVKGHRTTQTSARFTSDTDENLERATVTNSDMMTKDLLGGSDRAGQR